MATIKNLVLGFSSSQSSSINNSTNERHERNNKSNGNNSDSGFLDQTNEISQQMNNETNKKLTKAFGKLLSSASASVNDDENNNIPNNNSSNVHSSIFNTNNVVQSSQVISSVIIRSASKDKACSSSCSTDILNKFLPGKLKIALEEIIQNNRIKNFIERQDYAQIRNTHSRTNLFEDKEFPRNDSSVFFTDAFRDWLKREGKINQPIDYRLLQSKNLITWKRAKDLSDNAQFAVDDKGKNSSNGINDRNYKKFFHTTDLDQGCLGNCWFISAATGVIQNYALFRRVVPFDNTFDDRSYNGAFHFRFWMYGEWKDVVIDDYLPVGPDGKLIFCKNRENSNEFWCSLLEKAYAKICGSYEALEGGFTSDALIDMSGGVEEVYELSAIRNSCSRLNKNSKMPVIDADIFWDILTSARKKESVIGCNINLSMPSNTTSLITEVKLSNGLVAGHAYIMTKVAQLEIGAKEAKLVRLYNPWGNDVEWNGDWSDQSPLWKLIESKVKEQLELKIENDGEFWMSYEDWLKNFDHCQICNLTPETITEISESDWENQRLLSSIFSMWQPQFFHGKWVEGVSAGGRGQHNQDMFLMNPHFSFELTSQDMIQENKCWVIIALMQKYTRKKRFELQAPAEEYIQYRLFKVKDAKLFKERSKNGESVDLSQLDRVGSSGSYTNKREVTARFQLESGIYIIIPSTYDEGKEGEFLLRIFTEKPLNKEQCMPLMYPKTLTDGSVSTNMRIMNNLLKFTEDYSIKTIDNKDYSNGDVNNRDASMKNYKSNSVDEVSLHKLLERRTKSQGQPSINCNQM